MTLGLPGVEIDGPRRTRLASSRQCSHLARLTVNARWSPNACPALKWAGAYMSPPPGAFLQAVPSAEQAMQTLVLKRGNSRRVADLFAGCGTFTFPLAKTAAVSAFEADIDAVSALKEAAKHAHGLKLITVERPHLFRGPY